MPVVTCIKPSLDASKDSNDDDSFDWALDQHAASYAFSSSLQTWCSVSDPLRFLDSEFYSNLVLPKHSADTLSHATSKRTALASIHAFTARAAQTLGVLDGRDQFRDIVDSEDSSTPQGRADSSRAHLETLVSSAVLLSSKVEYVEWLQAYCTRLCETAEVGKLRALCTGLLGPVAPSDQITTKQLEVLNEVSVNGSIREGFKDTGLDPSEWQPTVLGIDKRQLLADTILPMIASNRELQRLSNQFSNALKEVAPGAPAKENKASNALLEERMKQR